MKASNEVVVVIDPGHGGPDVNSDAENGAMYNDELPEKHVNLITSLAMKEELEKYNNVRVYLTRDDDYRMSLEERVDYANSVDADVMVCCHYNASENHLFYGAEIFTSAFGRCYATGAGLAECIMNQWVSDGSPSKGIKVRLGESGNDYYGVIRHGKSSGLPVIIIEHGYLDNHFDYARLGTEDDWKRMGYLDATGIANYFGLSKSETYEEVLPTVNIDVPENYVCPDDTPPTSVELNIVDVNPIDNEITYEISAIEADGQLMYYGLAMGDEESVLPEDYADLMLWEDGRTDVSGVFSVPSGYTGPIVARVYNTYEKYTDSEPVEVDLKAALMELEALSENEVKEEQPVVIRPETVKTSEPVQEEDEGFFFFLGGRRADGNTRMTGKRFKALVLMVSMCVIILLAIISVVIIQVKSNRRGEASEDYDENDM